MIVMLSPSQNALEEEEKDPVLTVQEEDVPEKSADPPQQEKQDDLPPTEVTRSAHCFPHVAFLKSEPLWSCHGFSDAANLSADLNPLSFADYNYLFYTGICQ